MRDNENVITTMIHAVAQSATEVSNLQLERVAYSNKIEYSERIQKNFYHKRTMGTFSDVQIRVNDLSHPGVEIVCSVGDNPQEKNTAVRRIKAIAKIISLGGIKYDVLQIHEISIRTGDCNSQMNLFLQDAIELLVLLLWMAEVIL